MDKKKTILFFIRIMLLLIIIVCLTQIGQAYYLSVRHRQQQEKINTTANTTKSQNIQQQTTLPQECILQENEKMIVMIRQIHLASWNVFRRSMQKIAISSAGLRSQIRQLMRLSCSAMTMNIIFTITFTGKKIHMAAFM